MHVASLVCYYIILNRHVQVVDGSIESLQHADEDLVTLLRKYSTFAEKYSKLAYNLCSPQALFMEVLWRGRVIGPVARYFIPWEGSQSFTDRIFIFESSNSRL